MFTINFNSTVRRIPEIKKSLDWFLIPLCSVKIINIKALINLPIACYMFYLKKWKSMLDLFKIKKPLSVVNLFETSNLSAAEIDSLFLVALRCRKGQSIKVNGRIIKELWKKGNSFVGK